MKRILVISDLHCGSVVGLTPDNYQTGDFAIEQAALWEAYTDMVDAFLEISEEFYAVAQKYADSQEDVEVKAKRL